MKMTEAWTHRQWTQNISTESKGLFSSVLGKTTNKYLGNCDSFTVSGWVCLQQRVAWRLPQFARQLSAVLEDDLGGDDPQVYRQQLVALHHLTLVVLAVVPQQLPARQRTSYSQQHSCGIVTSGFVMHCCLPVVVPGEHPNGGRVVR